MIFIWIIADGFVANVFSFGFTAYVVNNRIVAGEHNKETLLSLYSLH
jgi:hypothetical protein